MTNKRRVILTTILVVAVVAVVVSVLAYRAVKNSSLPKYVITDLSDFAGPAFVPLFINDAGQVVGYDGAKTIFWEKANGVTDITASAGLNVFPRGISDKGTVYLTADAKLQTELDVYVWSSDQGLIKLGVISGQDGPGTVTSTNRNGQMTVLRRRAMGMGKLAAHVWDKDKGVRELSGIGKDESCPNAINDAGQVAGTFKSESGIEHAFVWDKQKGLTDLGSHLEGLSRGQAINNKGQVAGKSGADSGKAKVFLWDAENGIQYLATARKGAGVECINEAGQVVYYTNGYEGIPLVSDLTSWHHLWSPDTGSFCLNSVVAKAGWQILSVKGINNRGQIIAWATDSNGRERAVLMTPIKDE